MLTNLKSNNQSRWSSQIKLREINIMLATSNLGVETKEKAYLHLIRLSTM